MAKAKRTGAKKQDDNCPVDDSRSDGGSTSDGKPKGSFFTRFTAAVSRFTGRPTTLAAAALLIVVWAASGPFFGFGDTWQLVINTSTTIITFLMVFVIQASQNRDTAAIHLKLDELIRATGAAHNALLDIDSLDEEQLERLRKRYEDLAGAALREADIIDSMQEAPKSRARKTTVA